MRPFLFLAAALAAFQAAEAAPRCTPGREGEVACLDGKLCECRHDPGGTLTGRPAGARWNCGPLRPACGAPPPAETGQPAAERAPEPPIFPAPYPPGAGWR